MNVGLLNAVNYNALHAGSGTREAQAPVHLWLQRVLHSLGLTGTSAVS